MSIKVGLKQRKKLKWILYIEIALLTVVLLTYIVFDFSDFFSKNLLKKYFNPPNIRFWANEDKQMQGAYLQTLSQPIIKRETLLQWAQLAAISVNTLRSSNYQSQLNYAYEEYFTKDGAKSFQWALDRAGLTEQILIGKLSLTAVTLGAPIILAEGPFLSQYSWKVQVPLLLTTESLGDAVPSSQIVTLLIVTVPTNENPRGIGINSYSAYSS